MMWLKACPRCRGDLFLDGDAYGQFVSCIQCGHMLDKAQENTLMRATAPNTSGSISVAIPAARAEAVKTAA